MWYLCLQIDILPRVDSKERLRNASVLKDTQKAAMAAGVDEICHLTHYWCVYQSSVMSMESEPWASDGFVMT